MQILIVLTFDVPAAERVTDVLSTLDPPRLPYFDGTARVVVGEHVDELTAWLDEKDPRQHDTADRQTPNPAE